MATTISLTQQLRRYSSGEKDVAEAVLRQVLPKLHQIAVRELRRERYFAPLCPTELIHEAWVRSLEKGGWKIDGREHFYAIASLAMRRVLVDFARARLAQRRGTGELPISLDGVVDLNLRAEGADLESVVRIGILMEQLEQTDLKMATVVDMHYFAGFTFDETAKLMELSVRQVRHLWDKGLDWLRDRI